MWKSKLKVKHIKDTKNPKRYLLIEPLIWEDSEYRIEVPIGFETDFASIPKYLQWIIKPRGKHSKASVVHDFMYSVNWWSRTIADMTFYAIMLYDGVKKFIAYSFYKSVRIFGGSRYDTK